MVEKKLKERQKREWYEKFNWFVTSGGLLAIGGRSAMQNDEINSKHFSEGDLFFHADIFGASAVVLKGGAQSSDEAQQEAAQFAACYSSAWESGQSYVDVFAAGREQVSKSAKGRLPTGSFAISGEREWFKAMRLELYAFLQKSGDGPDRLNVVPELAYLAIRPASAVMLKKREPKRSPMLRSTSRQSSGSMTWIT